MTEQPHNPYQLIYPLHINEVTLSGNLVGTATNYGNNSKLLTVAQDYKSVDKETGNVVKKSLFHNVVMSNQAWETLYTRTKGNNLTGASIYVRGVLNYQDYIPKGETRQVRFVYIRAMHYQLLALKNPKWEKKE